MSDAIRDFEGIVNQILEKSKSPEDHYEVVALLESLGWNDSRATVHFGVEDLFDLGQMVYEAIQKRGIVANISPHEKVGFFKMSLILFKCFIRGTIFALPMVLSVVSMLTLKISLWSYQYLSTELATSIAIATILSFITVGGFTQAIARRGYFYISQYYYNMARKMTFQFIKMGYISALAIIAGLFVLNVFFNFFPFEMMIVIVLYYVMLCAIWLSVTVMYILQKEIFFTGLISMGIGIVYWLFYRLKWDIIFSQVVALFVVSIVGLIYVMYYFRKVEMRMEKGIAVKLPRMSITLYSVLPYFWYGFVYFAFLYVDRVMAWSTNDVFMPYLIWFRGEYELGLDFALLSLIIPMGINEVMINQFVLNLEYAEKNLLGSETFKFNQFYFRLYVKNFIAAIVLSIVSSIAVYFSVHAFNEMLLTWDFEKIITSEITWFVFNWALLGYTILSISLLNCVTMFSLSNPHPVNKAAMMAFVTSAVIGFLLSRWVGYYFAVFGFVAGTIVFLILTTQAAFKTIRNLDYHIYYSS